MNEQNEWLNVWMIERMHDCYCLKWENDIDSVIVWFLFFDI